MEAIFMSNERNAGRKPRITDEQLSEIKERYDKGESLSSLAAEYSVTRQALHKRLNTQSQQPVTISWLEDGQVVSQTEVDFKRRGLVLANYAVEISKLPFGFDNNPTWNQFIKVLEEKYLKNKGADEPGTYLLVIQPILNDWTSSPVTLIW